jgi:MFS family permease
MYITLRGAPKGDTKTSAGPSSAGSLRSKVPGAVLGLGVVSLLTDISSESVAAILPIYITVVVGLGPLAFGFIDGIYQGISAFVRIAGGRWADRSDRPKWVAFVGYGLSALTRLGLLFVSGFWAITSVVAADRLGKGLRTGPRDALIATASDPAHLGRNFGVHRAMDTAGALIGPLLAFAVLAVFPFGLGGYHTVFVLSAAAAVIGVAVLVLAVPDLRRRDKDGFTPAERPHLRDLATPGIRRLLIAAGMLGVVTVGDGFLYLALQDGGQISPEYFPLLFVGSNAAYLALAIPFGRLSDRIGRGKVFIGGHVLLLGSYVLAATHAGGLAGALLMLLLLGAFYAATDGVLAAMASREVPAESRASGISAAQTVVAVSRFFSSILFGVLWQFTGRSTALLVMGIGLTAAAPVAAVLLRAFRRRPVEVAG